MKERIEKKFPLDALGCMCGTSMDGLDLALIRTDGEEIHSFGKTSFRVFSEHEKKILRASLGRWKGDELVSKASELITSIHIAEINMVLQLIVAIMTIVYLANKIRWQRRNK